MNALTQMLMGLTDAATGAADAAATDATAATATAGVGEMLGMILPLVLMFVVFYFLLIRPQKKKDKKVKEMLAALKNGDRVCTIGGIYGTIDLHQGRYHRAQRGPRQRQAGLCPLGHPQRGGSRHRKRQRGPQLTLFPA